MSVLGNYVVLQPEVEKVLKFAEDTFRVLEITVRDPQSKEPALKRRIEVGVTEEDGQPISKTFSTLSSKLGLQLQAMHRTGELYRYKIGVTMHPQAYSNVRVSNGLTNKIGVTMHPQGYRTEYSIRVF